MKPHFWDEALRELSARDKTMKTLIDTYQGETLTTRGDLFYTLARSITGQQISVKAAESVWRRFEMATGDMTPQNVMKMEVALMRAAGLSQQKVNYLKHIAEHLHVNAERTKTWHTLCDEELIAELTVMKGVGRWTAEMLLIFHFQRADVLPLADLGLLKAMYKHYNKGEKMEKAKIEKLSTRWKPYRTVATWYLWRSLDPVPVEY